MAVHDLNHASRDAQHMVAIRAGGGRPRGNAGRSDDTAGAVGSQADTVPDPGTGVRLCLPYELAGYAAAEADAAEERGLDPA